MDVESKVFLVDELFSKIGWNSPKVCNLGNWSSRESFLLFLFLLSATCTVHGSNQLIKSGPFCSFQCYVERYHRHTNCTGRWFVCGFSCFHFSPYWSRKICRWCCHHASTPIRYSFTNCCIIFSAMDWSRVQVSRTNVRMEEVSDGRILLTADTWSLHRRLIQPTFHMNILETFIGTFVDASNVLVKRLKGSRELNITHVVNQCVIDILNGEQSRAGTRPDLG